MADGKKHKLSVKTCPTPAPMGNCQFDFSNGTFDNCSQGQGNGTPTNSGTCDPNSDPNCSSNGTCDPNSDPNCTTASTNGTITVTPSVSTSQSGLAVGGGLAGLPGAGSVLWATASRRRRKRRAGTAR